MRFWNDALVEAGLLFRFVPVDFDVFGGAAGGDQVGFIVAVQVAGGDVFAGHGFVVDHLLGPVFAFGVRDEKFDADGGGSDWGANFAAPARYKLIRAFTEEVGGL